MTTEQKIAAYIKKEEARKNEATGQPLTVQEAFTAGMDAFETGRGRAPALNARFIELACAEPDTAELLDEYLRGWDRANLDAPIHHCEPNCSSWDCPNPHQAGI